MKCPCHVTPSKAEAIQIVEDHLRAHREAVMADLEYAVLKALMSGIPMRELEIIEHTRWTDRHREADYHVTVRRKPC